MVDADTMAAPACPVGSARPQTVEAWRRLEAAARRKVGGIVLHPDACPKLALGGAEFAIPPRGGRIVPTFGPDGVRVSVTGLDDWPEARRLLDLATVRPEDPCPICGRAQGAMLEIDPDRAGAFLAAAFELAGRLLDRQYGLTPQQKAELLSFEADRPPRWIVQLLHWCRGVAARED